MRIQPFTNADMRFIPDLQPADWGDITPHITYYLQSPFCHTIKVVEENNVVGTGTVILHGKTTWLAHIIVHPNFRNKGIGKFITSKLVEHLQQTPCKTISLIATALGEPVYKSLGFEVDTEYLMYKGEKLNAAKTYSENIIPYNASHKNALLALDRKVSGEDRQWRLEENLESAYMYIAENALEGYYLPALGEGFIGAETADAGMAMMEFRLKAMENAVFPIENLAAQEIMKKHDFTHFRTAKRMYLGEKLIWQPEKMYNRVAGNIG